MNLENKGVLVTPALSGRDIIQFFLANGVTNPRNFRGNGTSSNICYYVENNRISIFNTRDFLQPSRLEIVTINDLLLQDTPRINFQPEIDALKKRIEENGQDLHEYNL